MDDLYSSLVEKSTLLHECLVLDVKIIDKENKTHLHLFRQSPISSIMNSLSQDDSLIIEQFLEKKDQRIIFYTNRFNMTYICLGVFDSRKIDYVLFFGPLIKQMLFSDSPEINNYYESLQLVSDSKLQQIGLLISNTIFNKLVKPEIVINETEKAIDPIHLVLDSSSNFHEIKEHYLYEENLLSAIESGDYSLAQKIRSNRRFSLESSSYLLNSIRNAKDLLLMANTLYSRAAIRGGVPIVLCDSIAIKHINNIERSLSQKNLKTIADSMISSYCNAVKENKLKGHSQLIKDIINYINLNLNQIISLDSIAEEMKYSPAYISDRFSKEMNITLMNFVAKRRVDQSKILLRLHEKSITDVAMSVGFDDPSYFSRTFKKVTGITPREYSRRFY